MRPAVDGTAVDPGPARQRAVFAALAVDVNKTVAGELITSPA